ncbi:MAG: hypothetical protein ACREEQ_10510, partial [Caulobacteraceae bacterium]
MPDRVSLASRAAMGALLAGALATGASAAPRAHRHSHARSGAPTQSERIAQLAAAVQSLEAWRAQETAEEATRQKAGAAKLQALRDELADANARAARAEAQADSEIESIPAAADSAVEKRRPRNGVLDFKGVKVTLGGFAAAETVYRSKNEESDVGSNFSKLPFANNAVGHT